MTEKMSIHEFAYKLGKTVPTIRHLIFEGNTFGKLPATQNADKLWEIDTEQLYIFPFTEPGYHKCPKAMHYKDGVGLVVCPECSLHLKCKRKTEDGHWNGVQ